MDAGTAATVAGGATAVVGALAVAIRLMMKVLRTVNQMREDWTGEPARPGYDRRPGIPERLQGIEQRQATIERQLLPNGGASMRDAINRVELVQNRLAIDHGILAQQLEQHLMATRYTAEQLEQRQPRPGGDPQLPAAS